MVILFYVAVAISVLGGVMYVADDFCNYNKHCKIADEMATMNYENEKDKRELFRFLLLCLRRSHYSFLHKKQYRVLYNRMWELAEDKIE